MVIKKNFVYIAAAFILAAIADMVVSTSTALLWYEPECPEELLK